MIIVCTISSCSSNTYSKIQSLYYLLSFKFLYSEKNTWQASFPIHDTKNLYYVIILMFLSQDWYKSIFRQQNIIIDVLFFKTSKDLHLPVSTVWYEAWWWWMRSLKTDAFTCLTFSNLLNNKLFSLLLFSCLLIWDKDIIHLIIKQIKKRKTSA